MGKEINSYDLSRNWFNFCFDNPEKISPNHTAIYFFAIEHCNRLGWKEKFGFPTQMAMDAIGIKKHQTYIKYFYDLVDWGFFKLVQRSKNQYSSNIITLVSAAPKKGKALDKAIIKHRAKQTESTGQSTGQSIGQSKGSILKQDNKETKELLNKENLFFDIDKIYNLYPAKCPFRNVSTGKTKKNKDKIKTLLNDYSVDELETTIKTYIAECVQSKTYLKNFSTFLNNLPDYSQSEQEIKTTPDIPNTMDLDWRYKNLIK